MSDRWDFYFCRIEDRAASIFVNLSAVEDAPDSNRPDQLFVRVPMLRPREDGLSSSEEANALFAIEDAVGAAVSPLGARPVGRTTAGGERILYYYCPTQAPVKAAALAALQRFPGYQPTLTVIPDAEWITYRDFLYPKPAEKRQMDNRSVVEALQKHGDPLTTVRDIRHFIYFPEEEGRESFLQAASVHGFRPVENSRSAAEEGSHRFGVQIQRNDPATWTHINDLTTLIADLAEPMGGDYDGWEAEVTTPARPSLLDRLWSVFRLKDA